MPEKEIREDDFLNFDTIMSHSQKLEEELQKLGLRIKHHEDNLKFLKAQIDGIDESILDLQVELGKYHSRALETENSNLSPEKSENHTVENILKQERSVAGLIYYMKLDHGPLAAKLPLTKDVLGVVATLGKVHDDNFSRILSEYLGLENMMAVVCKTYEGVMALEKYNKDGMIERRSGLNGLGLSVAQNIQGRYLVYCIENLRPYVGEFIPEDPQRRLDLLKPRLANGETPPEFIGFAVNMIDLDRMHLAYITPNGLGLRETLFYNLFSRLQVYKTRSGMQCAMPYISDGAISLDGGIMKNNGVYYLGDRNNIEVRFPISSGISRLPENVIETEKNLKLINWKKERFFEDMKREETLLNKAKALFAAKKEESINYLKETALNWKQGVENNHN
ncbi:protein DEFECTIVE IN MERISTEM SILENCING 3-like [Zingiber officinale]|uniref:protein DEFECTIVE IN MERISTEM SILENCING 3-like n=1 Tax=Zingiber officinale TaxID=94328 RepID=UPI001C4B8937|nr:protein DEFECTIVE IN MERISTEM SILENCING 3-like [Zingiber officinale]